jgi:glucosyl-3-phosphoglycerate synthase
MCTTSSFLHTVIIPGKEVASTVTGVITKIVQPLIDAEVVSRLVVIDAASLGGTGKVATSHGTEVIQRKDIAPELGPSCGKGDALWRALLVTDGDIAAFLDGDTGDPDPAHLIGIIGSLLLHDNIQMVRASFDRPSKSASGDMMSHEGGRITEILARPLLDSYWPELAGFSQPLAGEFAARRSLLENLAFLVSYGIEIATLVDTYNLVGLGGMAQTDVGCRQNPHQALRKLAVMAQEIMSTAMRRSSWTCDAQHEAHVSSVERRIPGHRVYRKTAGRRVRGELWRAAFEQERGGFAISGTTFRQYRRRPHVPRHRGLPDF